MNIAGQSARLRRRSLGAAALALGLLVMGCSRAPTDPMEERVAAGDTLTLSMWRSHLDPILTDEQHAAFDKALEEIKLQIMGQGVHGRAAIDEAFLRKIDGLTVREVTRSGLRWELIQAQAESAALTASLARVEAKRYAPEDKKSADLIAHLKEVKGAGLKQTADEIDLTTRRLVALGNQP